MTTVTPLEDVISCSGKRWVLREPTWRLVQQLAQQYDVSEPLARLLLLRGIEPENVPWFLNPTIKESLGDPLLLKDMGTGVSRLFKAIESQEKIAIFSDYDVDGATSASLLILVLRQLGVEPRLYIPDRIDEGYGPSVGAMDQLKAEGVRVVVMLDCGTTAYEPLAHARKLGLDVIVLDHHVAEPKLPEAFALVNPNRLDEPPGPYQICAAVGITFLFCVALMSHWRQVKGVLPVDLLQFLDLVAVGTVCDVVPLEGINRAFVRQGLKVMHRRQNLGLRTLADVALVHQAPTAYHLGFVIGPRINAGGRVGQANLGARLLSATDPQEALRMAQQLNLYNQERQEIEAHVLQEAMDQAKDQTGPLLIAAGVGWHPGVIGIVAGRLKEAHYKVSCVISIDDQGIGKGSGRSIPGVDLGSLLHGAKQKGLLINGGGHPMAGGFTIEAARIKDFQAFLVERLQEQTFDDVPTCRIDVPLHLGGATVALVKSLESLEPFGQGNPTPKFMFEDVTLIKVEPVGADHLKCYLKALGKSDSLTAMAFRAAQTPLGDFLRSSLHKPIQVVGSLKVDSWQGREKVTLFIEDAAYKDLAILKKSA